MPGLKFRIQFCRVCDRQVHGMRTCKHSHR
jgi:hypothetical protein